MKKISLFLVVLLVVIFSFNCFVYAENETLVVAEGQVIQETLTQESIVSKVLEIIDLITVLALPICAFLLVFGAVQYFIMGIRNLYKKKQGLILVFSSLTFYVIVVVANFVLTYLAAGDIKEVITTVGTNVTEVVETAELEQTLMEKTIGVLNYVTMWSLPFCAVLIAFGAVQFYVMGIRNLYKKRQGLLLMFGSIAFYAIIVVVNFVLTKVSL